jgi:peptide/nickel transport system permease protein
MSFIVFSLAHLTPGDPALVILGASERATIDPAAIEAVREEFGLNDPLPVQYLKFLWRALQGNLGTSFVTGKGVFEAIMTRIPATLQLTLFSMFISLVLALPLGVISAVKHRSWVDSFSMIFAVIGVSMPNFWFGLLLMLAFSVQLGWLPSFGMGRWENSLWDVLGHLLLPSLTLGLSLMGLVTRMVRSSLLEVVRLDYVITARAKGLSERLVIYKHALRNALIPVATVVGLQFGALLGGAVVTETIFAWPGVGRLMINAIWKRDYPMVQGATLVFCAIFVLVNLLVDITYTFINPTITYD